MSKYNCNADFVIVNTKDKVSAFKKLLKDAKDIPIIVLFKADFCGHCQRIKPKFEAVRTQCKNKKTNVIIVIAEVSTSRDLFEAYNIDAFPVIMMFKNGQIIKKIMGADDQKIQQLFESVGLNF